MILIKILERFKRLLTNKDNAQLVKNVFGNYLVKAGAMLVTLFLTPAYMSFFYSQKLLGMWFTVTAVLSWLMLFDFGIGGGLRNQLVKPLENRDKEEVREILSAGFFSIGVIVGCLLIVQLFAVEMINWHTILGVDESDISSETLKLTVHILISGVIFRFFCVLVCHILYAMQRATLPSFLNLLTNVLILIYMLTVEPMTSEHDLLTLALVHAFAYNLPTLIAMIILFATKLRGSFPRIKYVKKWRIKSIIGTGMSLMYLQLLITFTFGVKEIFITWFVGSEEVVVYNVYLKLIGIVSTLFSLALTPLWSAVTKAYVNSDYRRIKKLFKVGTKGVLAFGIGQFVLLFIMPLLVRIWLKDNAIEVSYMYGFIYCIYNILYMWVMMNYNFACGMGKPKVIGICLTIAMLGNLTLSFLLCKVFHSWITVIASTAIATIPAAFLVPKNILTYKSNGRIKNE